jgi:hypothetical protein
MELLQFPLPLVGWFGEFGSYLVYLLIGFAFGYVLEISGFGNSKKLAAQFYFSEMTVLKVMFAGIVVAMVLIFATSAMGLLDYSQVWVNPTYLWPGILGGLIMGVGFIIGGFCPGTSLVAAVTLKVDGIFFIVGTFFGIFLFGETVQSFEQFWHSSYMGRFTLMDWFGVDAGVVVVGVVLMALFMFWGSEQLERVFGGRNLFKEPRLRYAGAGALFAVGLVTLFLGQPTLADRWARIADTREAQLTAREVQIHPGELLASMKDRGLKLILLDVRSEAEYNLFHLGEAVNAPLDTLTGMIDDLSQEQENTIVVVMSNDEQAATQAWRILVSASVPNVYILEGGINNWLAVFAEEDEDIQPAQAAAPDSLRYTFTAAFGDRYPAATPNPEEYQLEYTPKIKLEIKRGAKGGGCG